MTETKRPEVERHEAPASLKPQLYIDMDNTLVDFSAGIDRLTAAELREFRGHYDDAPGIFAKMPPLPGALEAVEKLREHFDLYVLSTAPWDNPSAWQHKIEWIRTHVGADKDSAFYKRVILSHHKHLNRGDYLIDDRDANGAEFFEGEWIRFSSDRFPDWSSVVEYLLDDARVVASNNEPIDIGLSSRRFYRTADEQLMVLAMSEGQNRLYFERRGDGWVPLTDDQFVDHRDRRGDGLLEFAPSDHSLATEVRKSAGAARSS